ncbi:MAG: SUMF1/EgtB/PvdO family nonheme iron enzyme, partial [Phaeodactylibacter sp.]|nr:SUMF1/EgtB/PvdO family nonheme iron enzyme [Phaeodactylibacter sp.]
LEEANTKVARNLLENAEKDIGELRYEAALEKIKAAAALNVLKEEAAKAYLKLVHTLMRKREYEAAVEKIKAAPAFNVSKEEAAKAYLELVHTLILEREYEAAVEKIKAAPAFNVPKSDVAKAYLELIHTLIRRLEYEAAVEKIKAATAFNVSKEEAAKAYLELAFWFGETGQPERAVDLLNSAAQLVNSRAVAARLQSLPRDTAAARQKLRDAIQLFDKNTFNTLWARYYPVMVVVEGGTFQMGSASGYDEKLHPATVSNFQIAKYETTWWQYGLFCQATGKDYKSPYGGMDGDNPVVNVVWYDAVAYASWLSRHMGYKKATSRDADGWENVIDLKANGYRLPTEAEWEYAARQRGQKVRFGNGKDIADPEEINFDGSAQDKKPYSKEGVYRRRTTEVGSFVPNSLGLYDMSGNVWEWCWDWFGEYPDNPPVDYTGPLDGFGRVKRGGAFDSSPDKLICSHRSGGNIFRRYSYVGFRLARSME